MAQSNETLPDSNTVAAVAAAAPDAKGAAAAIAPIVQKSKEGDLTPMDFINLYRKGFDEGLERGLNIIETAKKYAPAKPKGFFE